MENNEQRAINKFKQLFNDVLELPVAIKLNDFYMEEYPPKLVVIDRNAGEVQPETKPAFFISMKNVGHNKSVNGK